MSEQQQVYPIGRKISVTQNLTTGEIQISIENAVGIMNMPIEESRKLDVTIQDSNGIGNQTINAFLNAMNQLFPKPNDPLNTPVEDLSKESEDRINSALKGE